MVASTYAQHLRARAASTATTRSRAWPRAYTAIFTNRSDASTRCAYLAREVRALRRRRRGLPRRADHTRTRAPRATACTCDCSATPACPPIVVEARHPRPAARLDRPHPGPAAGVPASSAARPSTRRARRRDAAAHLTKPEDEDSMSSPEQTSEPSASRAVVLGEDGRILGRAVVPTRGYFQDCFQEAMATRWPRRRLAAGSWAASARRASAPSCVAGAGRHAAPRRSATPAARLPALSARR